MWYIVISMTVLNAMTVIFLMLAIFFLYPIAAISFGIIWPWQIFYSPVMTNAQFKVLLDLVFNSPRLTITRHEVSAEGYVIWKCNGYYGFDVNKIEGFSVYQKYLFFKRLKKLEKEKSKIIEKESLKIHQLSPAGQILFGNKK